MTVKSTSSPCPYCIISYIYSSISAELGELALHCTRQEDGANKVGHHLRKSEAALLLESRFGQRFDEVVTGAAAEGVWVPLPTTDSGDNT